jgi:hypothetical protein
MFFLKYFIIPLYEMISLINKLKIIVLKSNYYLLTHLIYLIKKPTTTAVIISNMIDKYL